MWKRFVIFAGIALLAAGCGGGRRTKIVSVDGSSTVYPITEAVAEEFQKDNPDIKVTVGISGTGGGFKKFCRGETDVNNASRPIKASEMEMCKKNGIEFYELPIAYDAITVVVNPDNTWVDYLTLEELRKIWAPESQGKITKWSQIREGWPDKELHLYGPGVDSGTFDYFTSVVIGKEGASRGDYTSSEDDNVLVQGVASDKYALGYFGLAYYLENKDKLKAVPIDAGNGPVMPTVENVVSGKYVPLSRPLFIYVSKKSYETKPHVKRFVDYYLTHVKDLVRDVGYVELPDEAYELAKKRLKERRTGSVFSGKTKAGMKITDLLKLEGER